MLGILLSILKILGIILLAVLLLVILVLLLLLLVPVRYRFSGKFNTDEKRMEGKITWLFRLVHISVLIDEDGQRIVPKVMGINLKKRKTEKEQPKRRGKRKRRKKKEKKIKESSSKEKDSNGKGMEKETGKEELLKSEKKETEKKVEEEKAEEVFLEKKINTTEDDILEKSIFRRIYEKIINVISAILKKVEAWKGILAQAQEFKQKKDKIFDFFCDKEALDAKDKTYKLVKRAIRHIRPKKLKAVCKFGLGDPADTGQLYAFLCLMYGIYGKNVVLEPDFENKIFEGEFQLKGRIRLLNLIYYVIYLYRIKKLREFIELLKNL